MRPEDIGTYYESILDKEVRKEGGIYYTPPYIVNYIVANTVGKFLEGKTPAEAAKIKIVDPACGAGVFLLGAYQYLLDWHEKHGAKLTLAKRQKILTENIFGVDIDPLAVEITKYCLSMKCTDNKTILPNIDKNIRCGNSLISDPKIAGNKAFDWYKKFPTVFKQGGFDVIIGNPPYVKEYTNREVFENVKRASLYLYYQGKMDLCYFFVCLGIDLLKKGGQLGFIIPNNWTTNSGASILRHKIATESTVHCMCDFGSYNVFDSSSIQTMILILEKNLSEQYTFDYRRIALAAPNKEIAERLLTGDPAEGLVYLQPTLTVAERQDSLFVFEESATEKILKKIREKRNFTLDEHTEIAQGIVPNPDVVNAKNIDRIAKKIRKQENIDIGCGVFVVAKDFFRRLTKAERKHIKPLYEPCQISRYAVGEFRKEIIYITKQNFNNDCPRLIAHLSKFKGIMDERRENKEKKLEYYHLHWGRTEKIFTHGPKILAVRKCTKPTFVYTEKEAFVMMAFNVIRSERINLKYLTAVLNSRLVAFWLRYRGKMQGLQYQVDKEPLLNIPLVDTDNKAVKKKIISLVDDLLQLYPRRETALMTERKNIENNIFAIENAIDKLVYQLYGLTNEEIAVIEGNT